MSEKTLKFNNIRVNKKEFHKSKQPIDLMPVNVDQIFVSDKFKHSGEGFKYFICYQEGEIVKPLCIILPQISGYIISMIKTNFFGNDMPKENMHYAWIACITIDSVMRMDKKTIRRFI